MPIVVEQQVAYRGRLGDVFTRERIRAHMRIFRIQLRLPRELAEALARARVHSVRLHCGGTTIHENFVDYRREGLYEVYNRDGEIVQSGKWRNGRQTGEWRNVVKLGGALPDIVGVTNFKRGYRHGPSSFRSTDVYRGSFFHGMPHGTFTRTNADGVVVRTMVVINGLLADGSKPETWSYYFF